jgi:hypothetical protein
MARADGAERPVTLGVEEICPTAARTKSKVTTKYTTKCRVENWPAYEAFLRQRGDVTVWFDEGAIDAWSALPCGHQGGQQRYSDLAILTVLTLRTVFHLALRPAEGFAASLIHLIIDSTGLKMVGDGEWHVLKHTSANKRRCWRKLHLGVDAGGFIVPSTSGDDVLPRHDAAIIRIEEVGRRRWRKESGAHQPARAENAMLRYNRFIGEALRARKMASQRTDTRIAVSVLNRMTMLGMPRSVAAVP